MNTEKTFADRLKELRNIRNYTQEELGKIRKSSGLFYFTIGGEENEN